MAGSKNDTHYSRGYNLYPTTINEITIMQYKTDAVQAINVDGTPEGNEAANVGSIAYDRTNGNIYKKKTGTGNTGWKELSATDLHTARLIVGDLSMGANYTTIAAALADAVTGDTIYLQEGQYTEDITLKNGVNLSGFSNFGGSGGRTKIIGKMIDNGGAVNCTFTNIAFDTNADFIISLTGSGTVVFSGCRLNGTDNTIISCAGTANIECYNSYLDIATTGIAHFIATSAITFRKSQLTNSGLSVTASTVSGSVALRESSMTGIITTSGSGVVIALHTIFSVTDLNTTVITTSGTGSSDLQFCNIGSGTASSISIGTGTIMQVIDTIFTSSNTNVITGAGTLYYSGLTFGNGSTTKINVTTQVGGTIQGGVFQAPSAGYLGEQVRGFLAIGSATALSTGTSKTITSISLTAGVWDISGIGLFSGATTGTSIELSISSTNNTMSGGYGDSQVTIPFLSQSVTSVSLTIPSYRVVLTTTTTYYLVGLTAYTIGSATGCGRISATRVG